jgi:hypothetical protein
MMEPNEVISKWLGLPRVEGYVTIIGDDYVNDPAAWTPEIFDRIEGAGLVAKFVDHIERITFNERWRLNHSSVFALIKSTPAQKAEALSRSIMECDEKGDKG